jgi:hypothetical protein
MRMVEVIQLRWDGSHLGIDNRGIISELLGIELTGSTPLASCPQDNGLILSFGTVTDGVIVYRFGWDGKTWSPTRRGKPFVDHAVASNVFLEGHWRHIVFYRVDDLLKTAR